MTKQSRQQIKARNHSLSFSRLNLTTFYRQVRALTKANLKTRYRNTWIGFLWVILNPMLIFGCQSYVFYTVLKINVDRYPLFLLSGLIPWIFLSQSLEMCASIYQVSGRLLKSFAVHPLVYLTAQIADNFVNFVAAFLILLVAVGYASPGELMKLIYLPLPLVLLMLGVFGLCSLLAVCQVFFRDTRFILSFALGILFYLTPIFYPAHLVPEHYHWIVEANFLYYLIDPFRAALYESDFGGYALSCLRSGVVASILFGSSVFVWRVKRNAIYFQL